MLSAAVRRAWLVLGISSSAMLGGTAALAAPLWQEATPPAQALAKASPLLADQARWVRWDTASLQALMERVPAARGAEASGLLLDLPMPDGSTLTLRLAPVEVMAPGLAARYPQIRSLVGTAEGQPGISARIDWSPHGFKAMVFTPQGRVFIDPGRDENAGLHQVYLRQNLSLRRREADQVLAVPGRPAASRVSAALAGASIGADLLTYRLALATTGEYARYQDPNASPTNKAGVLAELVSLTNRVTGVYERELGIRLQLIEGEDALIYTDASTDPYTNSNGSTMLGQNIRTLRSVLGDAAFDVGHVVSTGGGGVAYLGVVCNDSRKAGGVTGLSAPVGDGFYIDYVAHEMGHQFGANHTFNSVTGSCGGGNRAASHAYEPGSGTTIMAYAGICGADDIQPHSDAQFHSGSFDEIVAYTRQGGGAACAATTASGNQTPTAKVPAGGFTIPANTPFELTGKGKDADGDAVAYQWEERDLGDGGAPDAATGTAPLFRSFPPVATPTRVFPQLSDLLNNTHTLGELLPTESRTLNFRFIVRDNREAPSAGGVASADLSFNVTADAGPFRVTAPNTNVLVAPGSTLKVKWDVAKTDVAPVSCAAVDIWLSTDGGQTMLQRLKSKVANTGSAKVVLPVVSTSQARIKVKCQDNVFFDISDVDFRIGG